MEPLCPSCQKTVSSLCLFFFSALFRGFFPFFSFFSCPPQTGAVYEKSCSLRRIFDFASSTEMNMVDAKAIMRRPKMSHHCQSRKLQRGQFPTDLAVSGAVQSLFVGPVYQINTFSSYLSLETYDTGEIAFCHLSTIDGVSYWLCRWGTGTRDTRLIGSVAMCLWVTCRCHRCGVCSWLEASSRVASYDRRHGDAGLEAALSCAEADRCRRLRGESSTSRRASSALRLARVACHACRRKGLAVAWHMTLYEISLSQSHQILLLEQVRGNPRFGDFLLTTSSQRPSNM